MNKQDGAPPSAYNGKAGLAILCPITSYVKGYPFEVVIPSGLKASGAILSDQVKSLNWKIHEAEFLCELPESVTDDVLKRLGTLIRF